MNYALVFLGLMWMQDANAYLDAGTGSVLIQSAIASIVGGWFIIKNYYHRIVNKLFKKNTQAEELTQEELEEEQHNGE